ncbi:50S ribosomal protein L2, partial [Candidatus Peregrinibacteria bacterium]|nr:50S ribosomal protein L2 [Candidatus Peregrinibacteria bacterium]
MPLRTYKPTSPGRRKMSGADFTQLTKKEPEKSLVHGKQRISGRDSAGQISIRRRGGGHKRLYRLVDFRQQGRDGIPGNIVAIEYDPNRSARLLLVQYNDGQRRYLIAAEGLRCGDTVVSAPQTKVKVGNRMQLQHIPVGYKVHNIELQIGRGGQMVRSAGTAATLLGFDGE